MPGFLQTDLLHLDTLAFGRGPWCRLRLLSLMFCCCLAASAGETSRPIPIPSGSNILSRLVPSHPRLLASQQTFVRIKKQIASDPLLSSWQTALRRHADEILSASSSTYEIQDGLRLLATSRRVLDRVYTLAMLYRLEGGPKYAERAWQELSAAAQFPDWNPRHFLDTAEMTHAFAIAYDWLYDAWTPDQRALLQQAIVQKGLNPALGLYRAHSGWTKARHNWNQVCNGGIGMGALALGDVEPELAGEILPAALQSLQIAMAEFTPDGAWKEGPGYWNYATSYNVTFLAGLESALGTDFGLSRIDGFRQTGCFPLYLASPIGRTFNYADGGDHPIYAAQLFWLARKFHQPAFAWPERQRTFPAPLDLLWYDPRNASPNKTGLPLDKYFRNAEIVTFRSEWENPKAMFAGLKAGDNKANHSHLDLGSFVLDALGIRWAVDLGSDDYNLPGYFGARRWNYYRVRAEGHNTLVFNPSLAPDQDKTAEARIIRFRSKPGRAFAIADLTAAYRRDAQKVWRGLALLDRDKFLLQDEIESAGSPELWWFMHTQADIKIQDDGRAAVLSRDGSQLHALLLSPAQATFQTLEAVPMPASPQPERQAKNDAKKLAIHLSGVAETRIAVLLVPQTGANSPVSTVKLSPLSTW